MRPLKDSERLASSYMYESGGKKRHCSATADQTGELEEESRIYRFFKTDSSEKPHMHANKKITYLSFIWCCGIFFFYLLGSLQELCGILWNCYLHLRALKHAGISRLGIPLRVTG